MKWTANKSNLKLLSTLTIITSGVVPKLEILFELHQILNCTINSNLSTCDQYSPRTSKQSHFQTYLHYAGSVISEKKYTTIYQISLRIQQHELIAHAPFQQASILIKTKDGLH